MEQDRSTIGLTSDAIRQLEEIQLKGWFEDAQDIARFAAAYAIRSKIEPGNMQGVDTRWSIGAFDKSGEFRAIVAAFHPEVTTPVRAVEYFTNEGLRLIHERLVSCGETPAALLG